MTTHSNNEIEQDHQRLKVAWAFLRAKNYAIALREFSALAEKGHAQAWVYLGWMHKNGLGVAKSYSDAEKCYNAAASLGNIEAIYHLARLYKENGFAEKAFDNFLIASIRGHLPSSYWTGVAYLNGSGVEKDTEKAKLYLKSASDQGHVFARRDFYRAQFRGTFGRGKKLAGLYGWISAVVMGMKTFYSDPYGDRVK